MVALQSQVLAQLALSNSDFPDGRAPTGLFGPLPPSPSVAHLIDAIWDWDVPDADLAQAITINVPPSTAPYFVVQYRTYTHCTWRHGFDSFDHVNYGHVLTQTQSGMFEIRPRGPLGVITVRLKPEGASRLARVAMGELANVKIGLRNIFKNHEIALLEEMVMEAEDSRERIACIEHFLLHSLGRDLQNPIFTEASSQLRRNPGLRINTLANQMGISERHLSRGFRAAYGTSPKQYARLARIEKVIASRKRGLEWSEIAYICGFADQAHLVHDFGDIVGGTPAEFFGDKLARVFRRSDTAENVADFYNPFTV